MARKQCDKCPWKVPTDPYDIPNGYDVDKHRALRETIAEEGSFRGADKIHAMSCHEFSVGAEKHCVGWLHHQLGSGNNIPLRMMAMSGKVDVDYELDGEQHERFEDTLPR